MTNPPTAKHKMFERSNKYQSAKESKTQLATSLLATGLTVYEVATRVALSRRYVEGLKRGLDRNVSEASFKGEYALRTARHAEALIAEGGFESLSERCVGYDNTGNRRMVACLPIVRFKPY